MTEYRCANDLIRELAEAAARAAELSEVQQCRATGEFRLSSEAFVAMLHEECARLRAALAAFKRRAPLRKDEAFLLALESAIRGRTNWYPEHGWIASVADAIDSALFGTAAKEGSRG